MRTVRTRRLKKLTNIILLKIELEHLWKIKIMVIPVVVGALGAIAANPP